MPRVNERHDPAVVEPLRDHSDLANPDPGKKYVWADPNSTHFGVPYFEALGFEVERSRPGGPRARIGRKGKDGDPVLNVHGLALLSIDKTAAKLIDEQGIDGTGGQKSIDQIEKQMFAPGGIDGLRGFRGVDIVSENTTTVR